MIKDEVIKKFLYACEYGCLEGLKLSIQNAEQQAIVLPYVKGFALIRDQNKEKVIKCLIFDNSIRKKIPVKTQIKAFEMALNISNIEIVKFFLFNKDINFSVYPHHYVKKNTLLFNPFSGKVRYGKEIEALLFSIQLNNELNSSLRDTPFLPVRKKFKL